MANFGGVSYYVEIASKDAKRAAVTKEHKRDVLAIKKLSHG